MKNKILICFLSALFLIQLCNAEETKENIHEDVNYAEQVNLLKSPLSRTTICIPAVIAVPLGELGNFMDISLGTGIGFEYVFLPQFISFTKAGFCGRFFYQNMISNRVEISEFYSFTFLNGIFFRFNLPKEMTFQVEGDLGFAITQVSATSINYEELSDVYYDFVLRAALSVRRPFVKKDRFTLLWDVSPFCTFQFEKSETGKSIGANISVLININLYQAGGTK